MRLVIVCLVAAVFGSTGELAPEIEPEISDVDPKYHAEVETSSSNPLLNGLNDEVWNMIQQKLEPRLAKLEQGMVDASKERTELRDSVQNNKELGVAEKSEMEEAEKKNQDVETKLEEKFDGLEKKIGDKMKALEDFMDTKKTLLNDLSDMATALNVNVGSGISKAAPAAITPIKAVKDVGDAISKAPDTAITDIKKSIKALTPKSGSSMEASTKEIGPDLKKDINLDLNALPSVPSKAKDSKTADVIAKPSKSTKKESTQQLEKKLEKIEKENVEKSDPKSMLKELGVSSEDADEIIGEILVASPNGIPSDPWKTAFICLLTLNALGGLFYHFSQKSSDETPLLASNVA